jgi:hypothetical protein
MFIYQYFYNFLYRLLKKSLDSWQAEWKALLILVVIQYFIFFEIGIYLELQIGISLIPEKMSFLIYLMAFVWFLLNYYFTLHKGKYLSMNYKFGVFNRKKRVLFDVLCTLTLLLIIVNLFYSFYMLGEKYGK